MLHYACQLFLGFLLIFAVEGEGTLRNNKAEITLKEGFQLCDNTQNVVGLKLVTQLLPPDAAIKFRVVNIPEQDFANVTAVIHYYNQFLKYDSTETLKIGDWSKGVEYSFDHVKPVDNLDLPQVFALAVRFYDTLSPEFPLTCFKTDIYVVPVP